jgi:hypothetical protein
MRLTFTLHDAQEISSSAYRAFISTFHYLSHESDSDNSDSDLSDFDPDIFGCGEITPEVERMVENNWEICDPLDEVYGTTTSKQTVTTATEETQCAGLKFFNDMTPGEDRGLIATCLGISYWCCCETIKEVSPIIAEATTNLMY